MTSDGDVLYTKNQIMMGIVFGGPLAFGYFFSNNFKTLQKKSLIRQTWLIAFVLLVLILPISAVTSTFISFLTDNSILKYLPVPFIYLGLTHWYYKKYQKKEVEYYLHHFHELKASNLEIFFVSISLSFVAYLLLVVVLTIFKILWIQLL